jgi:hypothetical protein
VFLLLVDNVLFYWIYLYQVAEVLKDRPSWLRDCRRFQTLGVISTGKGGTIELLYTQMYAPTTLAPPRDLCTLRYTTILEDGNLVVGCSDYQTCQTQESSKISVTALSLTCLPT